LVLWAPWRTDAPLASTRLAADVRADVSLLNVGASLTMSRDGTLLAFVAEPGTNGSRQLYVRRLGQAQATSLARTNDATDPFFSPDAQWIGFFADGKLKKVLSRVDRRSRCAMRHRTEGVPGWTTARSSSSQTP
jgi:serine/threonine-protein kinase